MPPPSPPSLPPHCHVFRPAQTAASAWAFYPRIMVIVACLIVTFTGCGLAVVAYGFNTAYSRKVTMGGTVR